MRVETLHRLTLARLVRVDVEATVKTAALAFSNRHIGLLVVCKSNGEATGVVSKSDLVRHLTRTGAADDPVANLMSYPIISCDPNDDSLFHLADYDGTRDSEHARAHCRGVPPPSAFLMSATL